MCDDEFREYLKKSSKGIEDVILVVDEADALFFSETSTAMKDKTLRQWRD